MYFHSRLMNRALQDDSAMDEHGVAAQLLPLSTAFCRKLCTGVLQFAYTCIQDHPVWKNQQFWEATFYQDVQTQIKSLYLPRKYEHGNSFMLNNSHSSRMSVLSRLQQEPSALEIAAEQMRLWSSLDAGKQNVNLFAQLKTKYLNLFSIILGIRNV